LFVLKYKNNRGVRGDKDGLGTVLCAGGVAEAWKDNLLDELSKGESEVETVEELFSKMRNKFRETVEEEQKIEQLRTIEQERKIYNKYVQEFKKIAQGSGYEG